MRFFRPISAAALLLVCAMPALAQEPSAWFFKSRLEVRANYRDSHEERVALKFKFPLSFLPVGQTVGFEETVDAGHHLELSVAQLQLDAGYGRWFAARAKVHVQDKYRRNPTSEDKKFDADELWLQVGQRPEFLDLPTGTSFFLLAGKAPKMERQPTRLLESYGLAATAFNRFEDVMAMVGGSVGRHVYWRFQASSGNPFYFRDPNALAGDNGIKLLLTDHPDPRLKSGFPILYNAETEGYTIKTDNLQLGEGLGYRWQRADQNGGVDVIAFHYRRNLADRQQLTGTFYGADIDLLDGPADAAGNPIASLPIHGRVKDERGARLYAEYYGGTLIAQYTKQAAAGLGRKGYEVEGGYKLPWSFGPSIRGESLVQYIQPAVRWSALQNDFRAAANKSYVAPSVWWPWTKIDYGVRVGLAKGVDVTAEYSKHNVGTPRKLDLNEMLVTLRVRI